LIFQAILDRSPISPIRLNPDLPHKLEDLINKALEKDQDVRYQHASDIRADLKRLKRDTSSARMTAPTGADLSTTTNVGAVARGKAVKWVAGISTVAVTAAVLVIYLATRPIPTLKANGISRVTNDAQEKVLPIPGVTTPIPLPLVTDGPRIYFTEASFSA